MKFKDWLKINEEAGRSRAKQTDLQNVRIGKLGPYGTFGHTDAPDPISQGVSGFLGAMGKSLSDEIGRVDPLSRIMNPFIKDFETRRQAGDTLVLQLPSLEGKSIGVRINPNNPKLTFDNVYALIKNNFNLIRTNPNEAGKFDLFTYEMENKENKEDNDSVKYALREIAKAFTTALSKIRLREQFIEQYPRIDEKFDFKNPQVFQKVIDFQGFPHLQSIFQYKNIKSSMEDEDQYKNAWED
jgi:hypothetical protein